METRSWETSCCKPIEVMGKTLEPLVMDDEWILVRAMRRAAILDNPQTTRRDLIRYSMVQG